MHLRPNVLTMLLVAATWIAGLCVSGCTRQTLRHAGNVNLGGAVDMTGKMTMSGQMDMGELTTSIRIPPDGRTSPLSPIKVQGDKTRQNKIAIIDVDNYLISRRQGGLMASGENPVALFQEKVQAIKSDPKIKAVVLRINSPGGGVTASDTMCHEIIELKRSKDVPIIASILDVGAGGAYYLANHCDAIIAQPTSVVGGVGVILNVYNLEDTMGQFNILSTPVKSGELIDIGSPERPLAGEAFEILQTIAKSFHQRFINQVNTRRPALAEQSDAWSDGQVMTGEQALKLGMIDGIGYLDDAIEMARQSSQLSPSDPVVLYRRNNEQAFTPLDVAPNQSPTLPILPVHIPGLDRTAMPTFLYMWQADPVMATSASR